MAFPNSALDIRCAFAFGADLTLAGTPSSWSWKDCTTDVLSDGLNSVNIKVGRSDRSTQQEPNNATFRLKNFQGQYTVDLPSGVNYPNVVENVPGIVAVRQNLNPTFEVDASDWTATNGSVARSTVRAVSGTGSLLLTPNGSATSQAAVTAAIPVRPGGNVFVDAWVFSVAGWSTVAIAIDWYSDLAGTSLISSTSGTVTNVAAATWTYLADLLGPAPATALSCKGKVLMTGTPTSSNTLWIDEARTSIPRLCGYVDGWTPQFDGSGRVATVAVSMSSIRRRLNQGTPKLRSAIYRAMTTASVLPSAYWPCEDGADGLSISSAASPISGVTPLLGVGASNFASTTGAPGSDVQPDFSAGGSLLGNVPGSGAVTSWRIQVVWKSNAIPVADGAIPLSVITADGHAWELLLNTGELVISEDLAFSSPSALVAVDDGQWHEGRMTATQNGGNIDLKVFFDGALVISESIAGTVTRVTSVLANAAGGPSSILTGIGHFAVWNGSTTVSGLDTFDAMRGHSGETAGARITRLASEESIPLATVANQANSVLMGPQGITSYLALVDDCEAADMGVLCDPFDSFSMDYTVHTDLENQSVAFTLDHAQHQIDQPFVPVMDDALRLNDFTASRTNGGSPQRFIGDTSRGTYQSAGTFNVAGDSVSYDIAGWKVNLGTPRQRLRYPSLGVNYGRATATALAATWMATQGVGIRAQATNLLSTMPPGPIDILTTGYTESLATKTWKMSILGLPYDPWRVFVLSADSGSTGEFIGHLDTDNSALNAGITNSATSFAVKTNSGPLWTTVADDFPFDINIDGERITVTNITGAASPQTFTVSRSVNGVVKTHSINAAVSLWAPLVLGL